MKFKSPFMALLKHQRRLADDALRDWKRQQGEVQKLMNELNQLYHQEDLAHSLNQKTVHTGGTCAAQLMQANEFLEGQKILIERKRTQLRDGLQLSDEKFEIYQVAAKDFKVVEKLLEKRRDEFRRAQLKLERKKIDEIVVTRVKRNFAYGEHE